MPRHSARGSSAETARDRPWVGGEGRYRFDTSCRNCWRRCLRDSTGTLSARLTPLFEAVMRRSSCFALLLEASARTLLVELCGASRWIASELAAHHAAR
jgi:glutamine synthetase adenylyltransferase